MMAADMTIIPQQINPYYSCAYVVRVFVSVPVSVSVSVSLLDVKPRVCCCYVDAARQNPLLRGLCRLFSASFLFIFLRMLGDIWTILNTFCMSPCLGCVNVRRPFDTEMFISSLGLFMAHFLWIYFGGMRSWVAVYLSTFSQPTHMPFSIYFGYFFGIHSGIWLDDATGSKNSLTHADEEAGPESGQVLRSTDTEKKRRLTEHSSSDNSEGVSLVAPRVYCRGTDNHGDGGATPTPSPTAIEQISSERKHKNTASSSRCQVTVSNYSWLMRLITFDQSLHCEHHDFPKIPCHLLGKLRHIAPEFYEQGSAAGVQSYHYFLSPWITFLYADPSQYASCTESLD